MATGEPEVPLPTQISASTESAVSGIVCGLRFVDAVVVAERVMVIVIVDLGPLDDEPLTGEVTFGLTDDECEPPPHAAATERARERPTQRNAFTERLLRAKRDR